MHVMKDSRFWPMGLSATLAVAAAIPAGPLQAQSADPRATVLEEVTVTARRVEESLQDTPVSVTAFGSHDLEQLGITEVDDIGELTPNLEIQRLAGGQPSFGFSIRGVSFSDDTLSFDPTVGTYIDGVYIARMSATSFQMLDAERIEVLRGPQGTLFGRNTIGGAINIVTQKPRDQFAFKQKVGFGDDGYQNYQTTLDTGRHGTVAARLSALYTEEDGDITSAYTGNDLGASETTAFRLAINWQPTDTLSVDYVYDKSDWEGTSATAQLTHVRDVFADPAGMFYGGPYYEQAKASASAGRLSKLPIANAPEGGETSDIDGHALTVDWMVSPELTISSISSYRDWHGKSQVDEFGGSFPADGMTLFDAATFTPIPAGTLVPIYSGFGRDRAQRQWSQELQFIGQLFNGRFEYNAGMYYFGEAADVENPQQFVLPTCFVAAAPCGTSIVAGAPFLDYSIDNEAYAAYGEFTYNITDALGVTLGMRYSVDKKEIELTNTLSNDVNDPMVLQTVDADESWNNFSPSLIIDYRWSEQLSTYAKVVTGYRSGGFNSRATTVTELREPFDQEEITSYELGLKSDLFDQSLRLNGNIFHMVYEDRQISQFQTGSLGAAQTIVNAGESSTSGLELEATWLPTAGLRMTLNYGYLDLEYDEFITAVVDPVSGLPTGINEDIADRASEIVHAPKHTGSLGVEYQFKPWRFGQLMLRAGASYTSESDFHNQFNLFNTSDDHWLVNARATLADIPAGPNGQLKVALWGKNLADKEYREFSIDWGQLGFVTSTYGPLRSYGVDIVYEFNR